MERVFVLNGVAFGTLFDTSAEKLLKLLTEALYSVIFKVKILEREVGYVMAVYDDGDLYRRKWWLRYMALEETAYSVSALHHVLTYLWQHDPV